MFASGKRASSSPEVQSRSPKTFDANQVKKLVPKLKDANTGLAVKTTMYKLKPRKNTFHGRDLVNWLLENEQDWITDREEAKQVGQMLIDLKIVKHIQNDIDVLVDGKRHVYQFRDYQNKDAPPSSTFTFFMEHPDKFLVLGETFCERIETFLDNRKARCFHGSEGVKHLTEHLNITTEEAISLGQNLMDLGLFEEATSSLSLSASQKEETDEEEEEGFKDSPAATYRFRDMQEFSLRILLLSEHTKHPGIAKAKQGFKPLYPVVLVPGLASSALEVWQSDEKKDWENERAWVDPLKIGAAAKMKEAKFKASRAAAKLKKERSKLSVEEIQLKETLQREWTRHVMLQPDGFSDPPGIRLRAVEGIHGIDYLSSGGIGRKATYVWSKVIEALRHVGYDVKNLHAAPYDWRLPPCKLEERDGYFTRLRNMVQQAYELNNQRVVLIGHSMGCRTVQYFLEFARVKHGQEWIDKHVHAFLALGPPFLGSPKAFRGLLSGDPLGLDLFLVLSEARTLGRTLGSIPWLRPLKTELLPDAMARLRDEDTKDKDATWKEAESRALLLYSFPQAMTRWKMYMMDPYFFNGYTDMDTGESKQELPPVLRPPPVDNLWAIYGINLPTEVSYYYKKIAEKELGLDSAADKHSNKFSEANPHGLKIKGGMAYEVPTTEQKLHNVHRSGDGTVPYASLAYCKLWKEEEDKKEGGVKIDILEIDGAEHREMMANKVVLNAILDKVCEHPICPLSNKPRTL